MIMILACYNAAMKGDEENEERKAWNSINTTLVAYLECKLCIIFGTIFGAFQLFSGFIPNIMPYLAWVHSDQYGFAVEIGTHVSIPSYQLDHIRRPRPPLVGKPRENHVRDTNVRWRHTVHSAEIHCNDCSILLSVISRSFSSHPIIVISHPIIITVILGDTDYHII